MPRNVRKDSRSTDGDESTSRVAHQAVQLVRLSVRWSLSMQRSTVLRSLSVYPPNSSRNGLWLVVGHGWDQGYKVVAFHRAPDLLTALLGFLQRLQDGKLVWKEDDWAQKDIRIP